ncbi:MAG: hypothetical protein KDD60_00700 [Bdellovibrionales bacterium]|nr:hypothetical protein [Bdellovibrionales bacterium]
MELSPKDTCNSRAYLRTPLESFIKQRFPYGAPIRLGIIPFATPANFAAHGDELPGIGQELARHLQREFLSHGAVTITEILPRSDWPGQREEFYHGNFRSIAMAHDAGFDLVLVGIVEPPNSLDSLSAHAKLIEVEGGITIWNGSSTVGTNRRTLNNQTPNNWWATYTPNDLQTNLLIEKLAQCLVQDALLDEVTPE